MTKLSKDLLRLSQWETVRFIVDNPACGIFNDMGAGKTIATITAIEKLFREKQIKKALIVSTLLVARDTWPEEIESWAHTSHLTFKLLYGSPPERLKKARGLEQVHIINQENFVWLAEQAGKKWPYDMVVFDDAKGFKSASRRSKPSSLCVHGQDCLIYMHDEGSQACTMLCKDYKAPPRRYTRFGALCALRPQIKRLVHLTGTPSSKGLLDLWPMIFTLDNGARLERTYTMYKNKYFNRGHNGFDWELKADSEAKIHSKIKDICIAIESEAELPPLKNIDYEIELPKEAAEMYDQFEKELLLYLDDDIEIEAANRGVLAGKLLQVCGGAVYHDEKEWAEIHIEKFKALDEIMARHTGEPILIGYNFKHELERLKQRYPHGIDIRDRKDAVHAWNAGEILLMFAHPASAGHGLNLQRGPGRVLIWFGLNWSLDLNKQLNKRLWRPGQARECFIYYIVAKGRADTQLMEGVAKYDWTQNQLLEAVKRQAESRID